MTLLLDSGILGFCCHAAGVVREPANTRVADLHHAGHTVIIPEAADYELRRKLLHLVASGGSPARILSHLDALAEIFTYAPLTTEILRDAAELWADARCRGIPTAAEGRFDFDVILAAQARAVRGSVVTTNVKHLSRYVPTLAWEDVADLPPAGAGEE